MKIKRGLKSECVVWKRKCVRCKLGVVLEK